MRRAFAASHPWAAAWVATQCTPVESGLVRPARAGNESGGSTDFIVVDPPGVHKLNRSCA